MPDSTKDKLAEKHRRDLAQACDEGNHAAVQSLIEEAPQLLPVKLSPSGTALHIAALRGHLDIVHSLIEARANLNLVNDVRDTALHLAAEEDFPSVCYLLIQGRAELHLLDRQQQTALHRAVFSGAEEAMHVLLDAEA